MTAPVQQVRPADVAALLQGLQADDPHCTPVLLDVREPAELATARIDLPGTRFLHIPLRAVPARMNELDPTQPVLALCHHGARSQQCLMFLQQQGFDTLINIAGGIDAWSRDVDPQVPRY